MLVASVRALTRNDISFAQGAAANIFDRDRFPYHVGGKLRVHVLHPHDRMRTERDQQIADHDAGLLRGALRLHFDDNGGGFFISLQRLPESFG